MQYTCKLWLTEGFRCRSFVRSEIEMLVDDPKDYEELHEMALDHELCIHITEDMLTMSPDQSNGSSGTNALPPMFLPRFIPSLNVFLCRVQDWLWKTSAPPPPAPPRLWWRWEDRASSPCRRYMTSQHTLYDDTQRRRDMNKYSSWITNIYFWPLIPCSEDVEVTQHQIHPVTLRHTSHPLCDTSNMWESPSCCVVEQETVFVGATRGFSLLSIWFVAFLCRRLHAGSLSLRPTGTASLLMILGCTRRTACSGRSSARTPRTVTRSAVPRSWVTAAAIRASPISAPACSTSSTRSPSKEPTSTSPWTWPAKRSPSLWCDGGGNEATFAALRPTWRRVRPQGTKPECRRGGLMSKLAACRGSLHLPLQTIWSMNQHGGLLLLREL